MTRHYPVVPQAWQNRQVEEHMRVEPTRSYSNSRRPVRSVGIWPSLAKKLLLLSRLVSGHLTITATTSGLERLPPSPSPLQTLTNPISFQPKGEPAAQPDCLPACLPANLHHLALLFIILLAISGRVRRRRRYTLSEDRHSTTTRAALAHVRIWRPIPCACPRLT